MTDTNIQSHDNYEATLWGVHTDIQEPANEYSELICRLTVQRKNNA